MLLFPFSLPRLLLLAAWSQGSTRGRAGCPQGPLPQRLHSKSSVLCSRELRGSSSCSSRVPFGGSCRQGAKGETCKGDTVLLVSCHLRSVMWGQEQGDTLCCWLLTQEAQPQPKLRNSVCSFGLAAVWVLSEIRTRAIYGFERESKR